MMETPPILTVHDLSVVFPDNNGGLRALENVSFEVCPQEFICFLGPSGSGKTALLRILAGILAPTSGQVHFVRSQHPKIGMVFQQANLMPWRSVMDNIKLPLELEGMSETKARRRAQEMIELVGLQGFEDNCRAIYPVEWHNALPWHGRSFMTLTCSCSMSRLARWMRSPVNTCGRNYPASGRRVKRQ